MPDLREKRSKEARKQSGQEKSVGIVPTSLQPATCSLPPLLQVLNSTSSR
jgi:hypothetical protein